MHSENSPSSESEPAFTVSLDEAGFGGYSARPAIGSTSHFGSP